MKTSFNLTTCREDLDRFPDRAALLQQLEGFDGLELLCCEEDARGLIAPELVTGLHMSFFPYWLDFWNGDERACLDEFGTREAMVNYYGGAGPEALLKRFSRDLDFAARYGAAYVVFHVSDASIRESFTGRYRHSDREVIDGACALLNALFADRTEGPLLLLENLWQPGLRFTDPAMTERLLSGIDYPHKGLMLDTGHLFHTNWQLQTQEEGLAYIHRLLDRHGALAGHICGVHINQSITGDYVLGVQNAPPELAEAYEARGWQMLEHAFKTDLHRPFTCPGARGLIERIAPEYLTYEFISRSAKEQRALLARQKRALGELS